MPIPDCIGRTVAPRSSMAARCNRGSASMVGATAIDGDEGAFVWSIFITLRRFEVCADKYLIDVPAYAYV